MKLQFIGRYVSKGGFFWCVQHDLLGATLFKQD